MRVFVFILKMIKTTKLSRRLDFSPFKIFKMFKKSGILRIQLKLPNVILSIHCNADCLGFILAYCVMRVVVICEKLKGTKK